MLNKTFFIGRLTKDPKAGGTQDNPVTSLMLAVNRPYTNSQNQREADFPIVKAFKHKNLAQNCAKFLKKGSLVFVEAEYRTGSYQDKNNNNKTVFTTELVAQDVQFLTPLNGGNGNQNNQSHSNNQNNNFNNNQNNNHQQDNPFGNGEPYQGNDPFNNGGNNEPWPY